MTYPSWYGSDEQQSVREGVGVVGSEDARSAIGGNVLRALDYDVGVEDS